MKSPTRPSISSSMIICLQYLLCILNVRIFILVMLEELVRRDENEVVHGNGWEFSSIEELSTAWFQSSQRNGFGAIPQGGAE